MRDDPAYPSVGPEAAAAAAGGRPRGGAPRTPAAPPASPVSPATSRSLGRRLDEASRRRARVLAIDDEPEMAAMLETLLGRAGYEVRTALSGASGEALFERWQPDTVVVDLRLPDIDGLELLRRFRASQPSVAVVILTGHGSVPKAVEAMKAGAHSFLEKPVEPDTLLALIERALEHRQLVDENRALRRQLEDRAPLGGLVGKSRAMLEMLDLVRSVAASDANVLIQGENGTGKELVANALHALSRRARGPFVKINCAAIPKDLIEDELFGHRRGAFTGAVADREGLFETASGGSLLLDEIVEMPAALQTKLLRVLQEREFRPIGSDRVVRVDVRLICATNADVEAALRSGRLREDLYFRVNTITVRVPPLRERLEDLPLLCEHFLEMYRRRHGRAVHGIAPEAYRLLMKHRWPGNVRELEHAIERGVLVAKGAEITPGDLPESIRENAAAPGSEAAGPLGGTLAEIERLAIVRALERTGWNKQAAARLLGLYRPTLYSKMRRYGIQDPRSRRAES
jgi:DNA-binding NtrC family response regulator